MAGQEEGARKGAMAGRSPGKGKRKAPRELAEAGKPEEAVIAHLRQIERNPEKGTAYVRSLPLLMKLKLPRLAGMIGLQALSAGVTKPGIYVWLARAKKVEGDRDGALSAVNSGLATHPENQQLQKLKSKLEDAPLEGPTAA